MASFTPLLIGNWKMQLLPAESVALIQELRSGVRDYSGPVQMVVAPSFLAIPHAAAALQGSKIKLGAQDVFWHEHGAYTGATSPLALQSFGVEFVIVGHSERRLKMGETDDMVARKMVSALGHGLQPILCVGETAAQRAAGQQETVIRQQLTEALRSLPPPGQGRQVAVAYEPIWAIGTGESANPEQAESMRQLIYQIVIDRYNTDLVDQQFNLLYGGSVDPENITNYVRPDSFVGALVGSASLKATSFISMVDRLSA